MGRAEYTEQWPLWVRCSQGTGLPTDWCPVIGLPVRLSILSRSARDIALTMLAQAFWQRPLQAIFGSSEYSASSAFSVLVLGAGTEYDVAYRDTRQEE